MVGKKFKTKKNGKLERSSKRKKWQIEEIIAITSEQDPPPPHILTSQGPGALRTFSVSS